MTGIFSLAGHTGTMTPGDLQRLFGFGLATTAPRRQPSPKVAASPVERRPNLLPPNNCCQR
jgi:hypothetical protein